MKKRKVLNLNEMEKEKELEPQETPVELNEFNEEDEFDLIQEDVPNKEEDKKEEEKEEIFEEIEDIQEEDFSKDIQELEDIKKEVKAFDDNKFEVNAAFADWFIHDLKGLKTNDLTDRKNLAIFCLTKVSLNKQLDDDKKKEIDAGGFLTEYKDYICENNLYLIQAILSFDGEITDDYSLEKSNWKVYDTSQYLKRLILISVKGEDYIQKHHKDFKPAIARTLKEIENGSIKLDFI